MVKKLNFSNKRWDLTPLLKGDRDPNIEKELNLIESKVRAFSKKWRSNKSFLTSPKILKQALDDYEKLFREHGTGGNVGYYFWLRTNQDQGDPKLKASLNKADEFQKKLDNELQFFELSISKIPPKTQVEFLKSNLLTGYKHFLERLFVQAKYLLSEPEEKILTLKESVAHVNWVNMVSGFLSKEERTVLSANGKKTKSNLEQISSLLNDKNKMVRDSAAEAFNDILEKYVDVAEAEINSVLANKKIDDELRGVPRPDLIRHISDDMDSEVVDAAIGAISKRFIISKRFYAFKAKLIGLKKLAYHERNVEYGRLSKKYSFPDSANLVYKTVNSLDEGFGSVFAEFVNNGHIDVYPKKGKRGGAFCAYNLISQPTYILLNHTDRLSDALTLAHEFGHGINDELIKQKQNSLNFGTPTSTAEVASTFIEDFVTEEILKDADDELKLAIMVNKLNDEVSTIFRQAACYLFEKELHSSYRKKGYLSKDDVGKLFQSHMFAYMGGAVEKSKGSENWWVYWSHIRMFFYVYSYASGLLISKSLQSAVRKDKESISKIKEFLSTGRSDSPIEIFRKLDINISDKKFWDIGLDEIEKLLKETEVLARKLGKI